jgi:methionyl-tRNA formyltransferase
MQWQKTPLFCHFRNKLILLRELCAIEHLPSGMDIKDPCPPGTIAFQPKQPTELYIRCKEGWLQCTQLQVAGRRPLSIIDWINGYQVTSGELAFTSSSN